MPTITLKDFNLGGMSDSRMQGRPNSLYRIIGCDIHSKPGVLRLSQALVKENGAVAIDGPVLNTIACSNGETYLFCASNGNIWRRKSGGTYEIAYTTPSGTPPTGVDGGINCLGAIEYGDPDGFSYIIWATAKYLHRIKISDALTPTWVPELMWKTFTNADTGYHPLLEVNGVLYVGDGNLVAQWDGTTFTANALDLPKQYRVSALGPAEVSTDLLIGTTINNVVGCAVFRWDTWSTSWQSQDWIPEDGVNCFLPLDNLPLMSAGTKGNLYRWGVTYSGSGFERWLRIPGDWTPEKKAVVYGGVNVNGALLFGVSDLNGTPAAVGVYELNGYDPKYPKVMSVRHVDPTGAQTNVRIGALAMAHDAYSVGPPAVPERMRLVVPIHNGTQGIAVESLTAKTAIGSVETRTVFVDPTVMKRMKVTVQYFSRPTGTGIVPYLRLKDGITSITLNFDYDADREQVFTKEWSQNVTCCGFWLEIVGNGNSTPEIGAIVIDYE